MKINQDMINQVLLFVEQQKRKGSCDFTFVKLQQDPNYVLHLDTYGEYLYGFSLKKLNNSKSLVNEKVENLGYYEFPETIVLA